MKRKLEKAITVPSAQLIAMARPGVATSVLLRFYRRHGMKIEGTPNYISSKIWFDGTDYSLIKLGDGCTISSNVRILTHDWAPHTVLQGHRRSGHPNPVGRISGIRIGAHSFVGTGSIVMPGTDIGDYSIVGAGTVARGKIPPFSLVVGSPGEIIGDVRDLLEKNYPNETEGLAWRDR